MIHVIERDLPAEGPQHKPRFLYGNMRNDQIVGMVLNRIVHRDVTVNWARTIVDHFACP